MTSRLDIALEHRAHDRIAACADLIDQSVKYCRLPGVIFAGLRVRAIHHHARFQSSAREHLAAFANTARVVVRFASSAEHDVSVGISGSSDYRRDSVLGDTEKRMGAARRLNRVDRDLQISFGGIFESDR